MIHLIIWSHDNACRLDFLLRSIEKYAPGIFNPSIIYSYSIEHSASYNKIKEEFSSIPYYTFIKKTDFYEDTMSLIYSSTNHVAFATTDMVIYEKCPVDYEELKTALPRFDNECFSFRLGLNTIVQNPVTGELQPLLNKYTKVGPFIYWNCSLHHPLTNYGYPFAVDLHVYRKSLLINLLQSRFTGSNELEGQLFEHRDQVVFMSALQKSIAVNMPSNINRKELHKKYMEGKVISFDTINDQVIGCHQGFDLKFRHDGNFQDQSNG